MPVPVMPDLDALALQLATAEKESGERMLRYFAFTHLTQGPMRETSAMFAWLAVQLVVRFPGSPERTVALRKVLEGKDAAVRCALPGDPR